MVKLKYAQPGVVTDPTNFVKYLVFEIKTKTVKE